MLVKNLKIFCSLALVSLATIGLTGCSLVSSGSSTSKPDGGIWRSADGGKAFSQVNDVLATKGKTLSISGANINTLVFDPQDASTIYAATVANGIFYSNDSGSSWQQFEVMNVGNVTSIAVDPKNKCLVYATMANKLYQTENCGKDWLNAYYHQKEAVILTAMAIDPKDGKNVYLGTSEGEVLKSTDGGQSWLTAYRLPNDKVMDIIVDPFDSKIIYVGSAVKGLFKSYDGGTSWTSLGDGLKSYVGSHQYRKLIYSPSAYNTLLFISKFGLLKTTDGGATWKIVDLLPAHKTTSILAVAVNPATSTEFYYVTASTLVKTTDGGIKWSSRQLPYSRITTEIKINPSNTQAVYLATMKPKN